MIEHLDKLLLFIGIAIFIVAFAAITAALDDALNDPDDF